MINRQIKTALLDMLSKFPVVTITGVRQCGKSTFLKNVLPDYKYISLEDPDIRDLATNDPRGMLNYYGDRVIIDEAQRVPELFSYLQTEIDSRDKCGQYVLSGSHNFLLMQSISQSLAGRVAVFNMTPFSVRELSEAGLPPSSIDEYLLKGSYPRLYDKKISPKEYFNSYTQTYVERDVRLLKNIANIAQFRFFLQLCCARVGSVLNVAELARDAGVSTVTANNWLSILEASFILYRLQPYFKNYSKRIIKSPKIYFYDTGLLCYMLNIFNSRQLAASGLRGNIFECMVVNEIIKKVQNHGEKPQIFYWRDSNQTEVDLIIEKDGFHKIFEIKSSSTKKSDFYRNLKSYMEFAKVPPQNAAVIYGGDESFYGVKENFISWKDL
ncbi:MAG: ATP-binding protein [Fibrobacter sp.]|nr:ATP-binding protein [Fibrobacter sp.]